MWAKCLALAGTATGPKVRAELTVMAERFLTAASRPAIDFDAILDIYIEQQMARPLQQQQQQPPRALGSAASLPDAPVCPACGKIMRLEGSSPATHYVNVDQLRYVCDCGGTAEKTAAHRPPIQV